MRPTSATALLLAGSLLAAACGSTGDDSADASAAADPDTRGCATDVQAGDDLFPDKVAPTHSELWDISYHGTYKVVTVQDTEDPGGPALDYVLVQCGAPDPVLEGDLADAPRFEVPVERIAVTHANGLAMLDELGTTGDVVALSGSLLERGDDPWYRRVLGEADDPVDLGGDGIDTEVALGAEVDLVVMAGYGPGYTEVADATAQGLPAVMVSNRVEPEPLGSAEWLKVLAAFSNAEAAANRTFADIEAGYDAVVDQAAGAVPDGFSAVYLCIDPARGCEFAYAHGDRSLNGRILATLGAENPFAAGNDAGNGMTFDYEQTLHRAQGTDLFVVYYEHSVNEAVIAGDPRYQELPALADGRYLSNRDENHDGCGAVLYVRVDTLIRDLAIGVAPDRFPGEEGTCFTSAR